MGRRVAWIAVLAVVAVSLTVLLFTTFADAFIREYDPPAALYAVLGSLMSGSIGAVVVLVAKNGNGKPDPPEPPPFRPRCGFCGHQPLAGDRYCLRCGRLLDG